MREREITWRSNEIVYEWVSFYKMQPVSWPIKGMFSFKPIISSNISFSLPEPVVAQGRTFFLRDAVLSIWTFAFFSIFLMTGRPYQMTTFNKEHCFLLTKIWFHCFIEEIEYPLHCCMSTLCCLRGNAVESMQHALSILDMGMAADTLESALEEIAETWELMMN